jgi:hypothetical protein
MDTTTVDGTTREDGWDGYDDEPHEAPLPVRPRRKFLNGTTALLIALITAAGGFYAGIRVEKNQTTSSGLSAGAGGATAGGGAFASRLRSLLGGRAGSGSAASGAGAAGSGAGAPGGFGGLASRFGGGSAGTVASVSGNTIVIDEATGNTVKVALNKVTKVTKSQTVSDHAIRPGDTIIVQGASNPNGTIAATSVNDSGNTSSSTGGSSTGSGGGAGGGGGGGLASLFSSGG